MASLYKSEELRLLSSEMRLHAVINVSVLMLQKNMLPLSK